MISVCEQRSMLPYEREMLLYPRVCATCYTDQGSKLKQCEKCQSVFFCCEQHVPKNHSDWCADLKTLLDINVEQSIYGNIQCALPHLLIKEYEDLPPSLKVCPFLFDYLGEIETMNNSFLYLGISRCEDDGPCRCHGNGKG